MSANKSPFNAFASVRPHEAYAKWPGRFWKYFHKVCPGVSRSEMEAILAEVKHDRE